VLVRTAKLVSYVNVLTRLLLSWPPYSAWLATLVGRPKKRDSMKLSASETPPPGSAKSWKTSVFEVSIAWPASGRQLTAVASYVLLP
jgi:hypothetical protein